MNDSIIRSIRGRAIPFRGDDIDTDRIVPARFLRCVTFDDLAEASFRDERFDGEGRPLPHPMNDSRFEGASIALVNANFGCGSSREHAPQALARWGIRALVGESFADIFAGNCAAIGVVAATVDAAAVRALQESVEADPDVPLTLDLDTMTVSRGSFSSSLRMSESRRSKFLSGTWDTTATLLANAALVGSAQGRIPYVAGFGA